MKITFLNESGVFGSYKKATTQSNIANVKKELTREAANHVLEKRCDELAELYLDMLNEVSLETSTISSKYKYKNTVDGWEEESNLIELSNYAANRYFTMSTKKEMQLNLIKNIYCNRQAIKYMVSQGCFILPLIDTKRRWKIFGDSKEIISYKNMTKTVATAAEKVIKSYLSKFPNYAGIIPNNVKIVIIRDIFNTYYTASYRSIHEQQFFSYMGFTRNGVEFEYPGQGSSCLSHILDNYTLLATHCTLQPVKSDESIWKAIEDPSPWMFNKIVFTSVDTYISTASANNFYAIKLLKSAVDNGVLIKTESYINILVNNVLKNIHLINQIKQEVANNGLDYMVRYKFNNYTSTYVDSLTNIGKEITPEQAKQQGILVDDLKRRVYEFDYNNAVEVKSAAKDIIGECSKFLTDANIKKLAEDKMEEYLTGLMSKVIASKPNCISSSNKILLCDYHKSSKVKSNIRVVIDPNKIEINKKNNLVFYIAVDFKLPVRGVNSKYMSKTSGARYIGKNFEYIAGKKIKIEIPL